jgi:hypothetical protein
VDVPARSEDVIVEEVVIADTDIDPASGRS